VKLPTFNPEAKYQRSIFSRCAMPKRYEQIVGVDCKWAARSGRLCGVTGDGAQSGSCDILKGVGIVDQRSAVGGAVGGDAAAQFEGLGIVDPDRERCLVGGAHDQGKQAIGLHAAIECDRRPSGGACSGWIQGHNS
jgi:hypothetical protein